jgi:hypothetical protein
MFEFEEEIVFGLIALKEYLKNFDRKVKKSQFVLELHKH